MPKELIINSLKLRNYLSFEFLRRASEKDYNTSLSSTAYRFVTLSNFPVILLVSNKGRLRWKISSTLFQKYLPLLKESEVSNLFIDSKDAINSRGSRIVPFTKWFHQDTNTKARLKEESYCTNYGIMTLLSPNGIL